MKALLLLLFALVVGIGALLVPVPVPQVAVKAPRASATYFDAALDNPLIETDNAAAPARKCSSCFG